MIKLISISLMILLLTPSVILAEIYKWINDDGSVGFTDDLSMVPEKYRKQIEIKKYRTNSFHEDQKDKKSVTSYRSLKEKPIEEEYKRSEEELSPQEKKDLDKKLRGIWENMTKSLSGR